MKIKEIMSKDARCLGPRASLKQAAQLMGEAEVGSLPVVDDGRVVGVLTDRDIVLRTVAAGIDPGGMTVGEVMTPRVIRCAEDDEAPAAALVTNELAAVSTYCAALEKLGSGPAGRVLRRIEIEHEEAVRLLSEMMPEQDRCGTPRLWRAYADAVESGVAKRFGDTAVLKALKSGEELEIRDYHEALNDERISTELKDVICETLLPKTWSHVSALERCLQSESSA